ncbi:unnamed protein product [Trichogramma brassicae]|uniref:Uncharacterized protein n=1 Tax=Trichogramma brassicae TaxID=86971 RepID=A0A6H5I9I2_9HYME|nr:unnamed protein product [Trichogramma brassicae]
MSVVLKVLFELKNLYMKITRAYITQQVLEADYLRRSRLYPNVASVASSQTIPGTELSIVARIGKKVVALLRLPLKLDHCLYSTESRCHTVI